MVLCTTLAFFICNGILVTVVLAITLHGATVSFEILVIYFPYPKLDRYILLVCAKM